MIASANVPGAAGRVGNESGTINGTGMKKTKLYWIFQLGGFISYTLINILLYFIAGTISYATIAYAVFISAWFLISTHIYRFYIKRKHWVDLKISRLLPRIFTATLLISFINYLFHIFLAGTLNILDYTKVYDPLTVVAFIFAYMVFYVIWSLIYFMYHYLDRYNKSLKYEAYKNEMELNKLKSQLNPHFIFNALNSIRALVDENPGKAKDAITMLSGILRSSLVMNKQKLINFDEELQAVRDYLELECIRFEERLRVEYQIDPASSEYQVPPLMIQTLVENGIKHGIAHLKGGGKLSISTKVNNTFMSVQIRNDGQLRKYGPARGSKGFGLENTRQRLNLIFGENAHFEIFNETENTVLVEIRIPKLPRSSSQTRKKKIKSEI